MLITVVKVALRWGMKEREQEVERKVTQVFSNEKKSMETNIFPRTFHHNLIQNQPKLL